MENETFEKRKPRRVGLIIFIVVVILVILGVILLIAGISSLTKGPQVKVKPSSTLVIDLSKPIQEQPADPLSTQFFGAKVIQFCELKDALKRAKDDDRIKSVLILPSMNPMSLATAQELKNDINELKKNKKVYAYFDMTGNTGYYIASSAEKIYAPPASMLFLSGFYASMPFLKGTFEKLKMEPQLYHIGDYKSASDMFMRKDMSEAQKEATEAVLDTFYKHFVEGICQGGRFNETELKSIIDKGLQTGPFLKESKLIDDFKYRDDVEDELKAINGTKENLNKIDISSYIKDKRAILETKSKNAIAVIVANGEIVDDSAAKSDNISPSKFNKLLDKAEKDKEVKAIVLRVDSPGGSGLASDVIWEKINRVKKVKPVVVSMSSVAGSGGYYISMNADAIVAEPTTITGSIGVITGKIVIKGLTDWAGVGWGFIKRGENADLFSQLQTFTPEQEKIIVDHMENFYKDFVTKAAQGRKMTYEQINKIAQGRIWSGEDALRIGLVDKLGGLDEAIELAKEKAKIPSSEKVKIKYFPKPKTLFEFFSEMSNEDMTSAFVKAAMPKIYDDFKQESFLLKLLSEDKTLYYTPVEIKSN
jgi:protease-4